MPEPAVQIDFQVGGIRDVLRAFETIETRAERAERQQSRSAQGGSRDRVAATHKETSDKERAYAKLQKEAERWERQQVKDAERAAKERTATTEAAAKQATRSAEQEAKNRQRIAENEARTEERIFAQSMRDRERMRRQETADAERAAQDRVRAAERAAEQEERVAVRFRSRMGRSMGSAGLHSLGRTVGAIGTMAMAAGTIGGGFEVSSVLRGEMAFGEAVAQASNMSYIPGTTTREQASQGRIAALSRGVQNLTNIDKTEAANAIKRYVGLSSDLEGVAGTMKSGRTGIEELAVMSRASGTDFGQLTEAAASIKAGNPEMKTEALMTTMRSLIGAGKLGTLPLDVLASHIGEIQATAGRLAGGDTTEGLMANQSKLLGLAQLTGRATGGDAAEAATAIRHLTGDIARHGIEHGMTKEMIYANGDPSKGMLDPAELLANVYKATGGRFDLEQKILGERAIKVTDALNPIFQAAGGGEKGIAAVRAEVQKFENVGYSAADTNQEFNKVMNTDAERLSGAMKHLDEVVAGAAAPAFEKFVNSLTAHQGDIDTIVNGLGEFATALVEHPIGAILGAIALNVGKDVAAAGIGKAIETAIEQKIIKMMAGSAADSIPVPGAAGAAGKLGGAAGLLAAATVVGTIALSTGDSAEEGKKAGKNKLAGMLIDLKNAEEGVKKGTVSPARADEVRRNVKATLSKALDDTGTAGQALDLASVALSPVSASARADIANVHKQDEIVKGQDALARAIMKLEATISSKGAGDDGSAIHTAVVRRQPIGQRPLQGRGNAQ